MKPLYYPLIFSLLAGIFYFLGAGSSYGQFKGISLGNSSPHTNSILDISSREKGVLFPRMTTAERQAIAIDAVVPAGLWVYDTDESAYYFYKKDKWELLGDSTFSKIRAFKQVGTDSLYLYQGKDSIGVQLALPGGGTIQNPDTADLSIRARNEGLVAGNARGIHSVDLQTKRKLLAEVASGEYSTVSGGSRNTVSGDYSTVSGGNSNIVSADYSTVSGGKKGNYHLNFFDYVSGNYSVVSGGESNTASGDYSTVSGGIHNAAYSYGEWVGGVYATTYTPSSMTSFNDSDRLFVVGNGQGSDLLRSNALTLLKNAHLGIGISAPQQRLDLGGSALPGLLRLGNTVATPSNKDGAKGSIAYNYTDNIPQYFDGTAWNRMGGSGTFQDPDIANLSIRAEDEGLVAGNGRGLHSVDLQTKRDFSNQVASGEYATLSGGRQNKALHKDATVSGGQNNIVSGDYGGGTVRGGAENRSGALLSTVGGGHSNTASGYYSTVGGGHSNTASGYYSTVGGGHSNTASGYYSTVGGGHSNAASGNYSVVSGGNSNTALGDYSTVSGGGNSDTASGDYSTVSGGERNTASGDYSTVSGGIYNTAASYGEWVGGLYATTYTPSSATSFNLNDRLFVVGNGTDISARSNAFVIYKNGDATLAGTFTQGSDRRLKKDIEVLENSLGKIGRLAPQKYNWIDTSRNRQGKSVGLIAQEVEKVLPHLVRTQEGTMGLNGVQIDDVKSVNYIGLVPYLIRTTQELNVQLEAEQKFENELQTELEVEKKIIKDMKIKIEKMESQMKVVLQNLEALRSVEQP